MCDSVQINILKENDKEENAGKEGDALMNVQMSMQEIRSSVLEDIKAREIHIPETGFLAGQIYPVRVMVETGVWRQQNYGWDNSHFPLN